MMPFSRRSFLAGSLLALSGGRALARRDAEADVIVIGAGASGLGAASRLAQRGLSVIVLEGRDRIGGRAWTDARLGVPLDLGAAWLHGRADNVLVPIAEKMGLDLVPTDWLNLQVHDRGGEPIGGAEVTASCASFHRVMAEVFRRIPRLPPDMSLEQAVKQCIAEIGMEGRPALTDWQIAYLENDYAEELRRLSLRVAKLDEEFQGGDLAIIGGYGPLLASFARGLDVRLSHRVTAVSHGTRGVRVSTVQGDFSARCALVTLPIGVLHASAGARAASVRFDPVLPAKKQHAAAKLGVGLMNKVILRFEKAFWTDRHDVLAWTGTKHGGFPMFVNGARLRGAPILEAMVVGDYAREIEPLSDEAQAGLAMGALRTMFGPSVPAPTGVLVTRWGQDPFALGAYSYAALGAARNVRRVLAEPVGERLFFAGEATHETISGTVHGAYLSGLREADRIASTLKVG